MTCRLLGLLFCLVMLPLPALVWGDIGHRIICDTAFQEHEELKHEIEQGVGFWGFEQDGHLVGVMGRQDVEDVTLIRHAYVRTIHRRRGIGGRLLNDLRSQATLPLLVGTWAAAVWAIKFYCRHGFEMVPRKQVPARLRRYWPIPERQIQTSVVLAEKTWLDRGCIQIHITTKTKSSRPHGADR